MTLADATVAQLGSCLGLGGEHPPIFWWVLVLGVALRLHFGVGVAGLPFFGLVLGGALKDWWFSLFGVFWGGPVQSRCSWSCESGGMSSFVFFSRKARRNIYSFSYMGVAQN